MTTEIDTEAAQGRVDAILKPNGVITTGTFSSQAPAQPVTRKKRSDAGQPKKPPADPDEITLKLSADECRHLTYACVATERMKLAGKIQDQIIAHLQKRIDALSRSK